MKHAVKKNLAIRLRRIEGQVRGLVKLVEGNTYCIDIITQAQAVKSALDSFESEMLKNHLETHVAEQMKGGRARQAVEEILKIYRVSRKR